MTPRTFADVTLEAHALHREGRMTREAYDALVAEARALVAHRPPHERADMLTGVTMYAQHESWLPDR